jgi:hypothetical protein
MTLLRRNTAADFVRDVGARTNGNRVWAAVLNADNTTYSVQVTVNGVTTVKYSKVFWPGTTGGSATDATFGDTCVVYGADGSTAISDTLALLLTLN